MSSPDHPATQIQGAAPASLRAAADRGTLDAAELRAFVTSRLAGAPVGDSVLVVVPDTTRTVPLPEVWAAVYAALAPRVRRLTVVVALGTHRALSDTEMDAHFGVAPGAWAERFPGAARHNHAWWKPDTFRLLGTLDAARVRELSGGLLDEEIPVRINRLAVEHDTVLIVGPVFPHEVVGFSGGAKYLFPGIGGTEMIDSSHWLGALIGTHGIIGVPGVTPVRALIHEAAGLVPARQLCLALVVADHASLHAAFFGDPQQAWAAAAQASARAHIEHTDRAYRRVLSIVPPMYDDLWTAAKGCYKLDPVTADGGEIVIYAPHLRELSVTHGEQIRRVGYHCRDYLLAHLDRLSGIPRAVLAHSSHVRGQGDYDPVCGERCRITVTLATRLSAGECHAVGLGHRAVDDIDIDAWKEDADTLVVPRAGERLYRLR